MAAPTLKSALDHYLKPTKLVEELRYLPLIRPSLTEADRAHLGRWLEEVRDPIWEKIAADARAHGELGPVVEDPYSIFIGAALLARRFAESQTDTPAVQRKRKQQREQQDRSDLFELAEKIEDVVRLRQSCRKAQRPQRVPSPKGPLPDLPQEAEAKRSLEWLGREAHRLRQLAEKVSAGEPETVRVSRQSGGKGRRAQSRELGVFMQQMVNCMNRCCGKPHHHAVATMTNIAFPDADVVREDVRSACRPTTRTARRKRCTQPPK
jgi:hypothetical protein